MCYCNIYAESTGCLWTCSLLVGCSINTWSVRAEIILSCSCSPRSAIRRWRGIAFHLTRCFFWPEQGMLAPLCFPCKLIVLFFPFPSDCWSGLPVLHPEEHPQPQRKDTSHRGSQRDFLQQGVRARVLQLLGETVGTCVFSRLLQCIISEKQPRTIAARPQRCHLALLFICSPHQLLSDPFSVATWNTEPALTGRRF